LQPVNEDAKKTEMKLPSSLSLLVVSGKLSKKQLSDKIKIWQE
jgi:hypothetical protein